MRKQYIAIFVLWFMCGVLIGQNERDAFRYARYSPTGTALYSSMSGSIGAAGGDFTALSASNPAGIGFFLRTEITVTLAVPYYQISSTYNDVKRTGTKYDFNCNNVGVVVAFPVSHSGWKKIQFGTGLNNLARYRGTSVVSGQNKGTIDGTTNFFDHVAESSYGIKPESLRGIADAAYYYSLMKKEPNSDEYLCLLGDDFYQEQIKEMDGALNEYIFSFGGNYNDKLFLGATLGIPFFNYSQKTTYTETLEHYYDTIGYDFLRIYDRFTASATGLNAKLGVIFQPIEFVRIGAAFHTPTWYPNVKEEYGDEFEMFDVYRHWDSSYHNDGESNYDNIFNYQLVTPYRAIANIAFVFKKYGLINIDYEFMDYSTSNFQSNSHPFTDVNNEIKRNYRETHTIRVGGEFNLSPASFRLGYSYSSNPYKKTVGIDATAQTISAGVGIQNKRKTLFVDFAYMYRFTADKDVLYDATSVLPYNSKFVNQLFALTLGVKFGKL